VQNTIILKALFGAFLFIKNLKRSSVTIILKHDKRFIIRRSTILLLVLIVITFAKKTTGHGKFKYVKFVHTQKQQLMDVHLIDRTGCWSYRPICMVDLFEKKYE
jgi:hypothetical protein